MQVCHSPTQGSKSAREANSECGIRPFLGKSSRALTLADSAGPTQFVDSPEAKLMLCCSLCKVIDQL
jgi:hypothetical protein